MSMKLSPKKILKYSLTLIVLAALGYGIYYSVGQYNLTKENITVCHEGNCVRTMHIHADLDMTICGTKINLPRETGPLNGLHTHKEKNYLHFHDKVPLMSGENKLTYDKRLSLGEIFEIFEVDFQKLCGKPREEVNLSIKINEQDAPEGLSTMWNDHDNIVITTF